MFSETKQKLFNSKFFKRTTANTEGKGNTYTDKTSSSITYDLETRTHLYQLMKSLKRINTRRLNGMQTLLYPQIDREREIFKFQSELMLTGEGEWRRNSERRLRSDGFGILGVRLVKMLCSMM